MRRIAQIMRPSNIVVAGVRLIHKRKLIGLPVELTGVDHNAANASPVPAHPLGQRMNDNVRTMLNGALQVWGGKGAVHNQGQTVSMCDIRDRLNVGHVKARVANRFTENKLGFGGDGPGDVFRIRRVYEIRLDAELWQDVVELRE